MMKHRIGMMVLLLAVLSVSILMPTPMHIQAYADDFQDTAGGNATTDSEIKTVGAGGTSKSCNDTSDVPQAAGGVLIGKIVPCIAYTIEQSTISFTQAMVAWISPVLYAFLTLTVVFYGVRVLQNEPEVYKQGFVLLVKIAIVSTVLADLGNTSAYDGSGSSGKLIPAVYNIMSESQQIVSGAIDTSSFHCPVADYKDANTPVMWAMMDCVVGKLYGFSTSTDSSTGTKKPSMLLATSVAGLLTGFLFGGAWGVTVFFAMIGVLFSVFMLVIRTVSAFLVGYMIICLLLILSPLFLPLVFMRATGQYFEGYWRSILRAVLMPIIITAYSMFALLIYDQMLFAPTSIVQKLFDYNMIKDALQPSRKACDGNHTGDPLDVRTDPGASAASIDTLLGMPNFYNIAFPTLSGGNDICNMAHIPVFKADMMSGATPGNEKEIMNSIFEPLIELFLLAWLLSYASESLPGIIAQLIGGGAARTGFEAVVGAGHKYVSVGKNAMSAAIADFQKTPGKGNQGAGYKSGGAYAKDLARDLPRALKDGKDAAVEAMNKKD